jgi:hypothetical protein
MTLPIYGLPVLGRDTYLRGNGRMLIRPLDLFTVQDGQGREFDLGELVTWVNDAVLMAPSMLLTPAASWAAVDASSFELKFHDGANAVSARVFLDERGAPIDFHTHDRWYAPPGAKGPPVRTTWSTPVGGWRVVGGRMIWGHGQATWKRPEGDETYVEMDAPPDVAFDVPPGP